mgnify:CR=1 FL=1
MERDMKNKNRINTFTKQIAQEETNNMITTHIHRRGNRAHLCVEICYHFPSNE